jgi:2-oxoglutarate ferredoxin oxidoreductase subunit beta
MSQVLKIPEYIYGKSSFCPGCGHGIVAKLVAANLEELNIEEVIGVEAVGCACLITEYFGLDWIQAQHGRAPAVAAGVKRIRPDNFVFTYQGDGDAGAIGLSETIYSAKRNEHITTFFINNGVFGMTGGQTAPTSLEGQKTTTSVHGVDYGTFGQPLKLAELLANFNVGYIARGSLADVSEIRKTREYIKKAIETQMNKDGYSFVEILAPCPTNWGISVEKCLKRLKEEAMPFFPCGELVKKGTRL